MNRSSYAHRRPTLCMNGHKAAGRVLAPLFARLLPVLCLGALLFVLNASSSQAACGPNQQSDACSTNFGVAGGISAVSTDLTNSARLHSAQLAIAGALTYRDYVAIETEARQLLGDAMKFRQDISPYQGKENFNKLVRNFDISGGFTALYDDPADPNPPTKTLQQQIDEADANLRRARDLYAFLIVYAPAGRMKGDSAYASFCSQAEDPNPADPNHSGQVLAPVIDWCNFPARLRQSVREAAYLRMIFAQQFMVDALGLHFSAGTLLGGDLFVRQEVAKLRAALYQYQLTEKGLREALTRPLGSGCYVSDFYTQNEWALLSHTVQGQEEAQHHIATRLSYLDITSISDVPTAQSKATDAYRAAISEGYIKLIGLGGMGAAGPTGAGCAVGTRPDSSLVAEMATTMLATRAAAREMREGRNIFGFDLKLTPARPYRSNAGDTGLWEEAKASADLALAIQQQTENAERIFDLNQQELMATIREVNNTVDNEIQILAGCDLQNFGNDEAWYACVDAMIENTSQCDPLADINVPAQSGAFDACMNRTTDGRPPQADGSNWLILVSDMRTARQNLRVAALGIKQAQQKVANILDRSMVEELRNKRVRSAILGYGDGIALAEYIGSMAEICTLTLGMTIETTCNPLQGIVAGARAMGILLEAARDATIEDANAEAIIRNLLLDMAEAKIEEENALAQYNALLTEYNGVVGQTQHDVFESRRQHAYVASSPANDPAYRMVRDSRRLELAAALETAARSAYLAARRAEYEYTARLSGNNVRISDIYKARTANDILKFLNDLNSAINNLPGSIKNAELNTAPLTYSVAQHLLGLTDEFLQGEGFTDPAAIAAERTRRFREWVTAHTLTNDSRSTKPILEFTFATNAVNNGVLSQIVSEGYDGYWLHKVAGNGQPLAAGTGLGLNLATTQAGTLGYRNVEVRQSGDVALTSFAGCLFDYRLIPPALLLGLDYPKNQPTDEAIGSFRGDINNQQPSGTAGYSTAAFLVRPVAANEWRVTLFAGRPQVGLPDMNLQQLTDIELEISTTYASRARGTPAPSECVRIDY